MLRFPQGLFDRQLTAGAPNDFLRGAGLHELEAVAEGLFLAGQGVDLNLTEGKRKLKPHDFSDWNLHPQHCRYARFADVDGVPSNHTGVAGVDSDVDV